MYKNVHANIVFVLLAINVASAHAAECGDSNLCLSIDNMQLAEVSSTPGSAVSDGDSNPDAAESDNSTPAAANGNNGAKTTAQYPLLKSGQLDVLTDEQKKSDRVWPHALPFLAQKVIDKGFDLPNPYGVAGIYAYINQAVNLSDLRIGLNGGAGTEVPFITFQEVETTNQSIQLKLDAWVFPFLNVFGMVGKIEGSTTVPVNIPGQETLDALFPGNSLCTKPPVLQPGLCSQDLVLLDHTEYTGNSVGVGFILPFGWSHYFVAIPVSYVYSDLDTSDSYIRAFQGSLRVGGHWQPSHGQMFAVYTGATYLNTEQDVSGHITVSDPNLPDGGFELDYVIHQTAAENVNYLLGFNWTITKALWLQAEVGFGGEREDFITSFTYRW